MMVAKWNTETYYSVLQTGLNNRLTCLDDWIPPAALIILH